MTPLRTSSSPSGTERSSRCWPSATSSCSGVTSSSASRASPMRTIGILACCSMACSSCSAVTMFWSTRMSPTRRWRRPFCSAAAALSCSGVTSLSFSSRSPMRSPISKCDSTSRGTKTRRTESSFSDSGGNRNRPSLSCWWPIVTPLSSSPPLKTRRKSLRGRWSTLSGEFRSPAWRGGTTTGLSSLIARNWLNFNGMPLRAGGTLMVTRRVAMSRDSSWPLLRLLFSPRISHGSEPRCACAWG
mmetsp:Transcript_5447/g.20900  ORF Transcript_5447/g.20900 Transcript_5447/m.20900 type:complete len:244 (-) Transcript_5447:1469-2200(-)